MVTSQAVAEVVPATVEDEEVVEAEGEREGLEEVDGVVTASPHMPRQMKAIQQHGFLVVQTMALRRLWLHSSLGRLRTAISRSHKVTANSSWTTSTLDKVEGVEVDGVVEADEGVVEADEGVVVIVDDTNVSLCFINQSQYLTSFFFTFGESQDYELVSGV